MSHAPDATPSRREFLQDSGRFAATSALAGMAVGFHGGGDETIQVALVGCGGRGSGAVANALSVPNGPVRLVAMADVFETRLRSSHGHLVTEFAEQVDVPEERRFLGFGAYRDAMDSLRPGDVVILATPPAFRWLHFAYAIEKGLHVFMEKPVSVDGPSSRRMFALAERSRRRGLKVGVGLMCRHCDARRELHDRIRADEIGEILTLRAYRMAGPTGFAEARPNPGRVSDLLYQVQNFHAFLWASGGAFSDFLIHNIDECCWMKGAWPVEAKASGGRHYRGDSIDQNFDSYAVEYTFPDGAKMFLGGRTIPNCHQEFASYAHGTRGSAVISAAAHTPARCKIYTGHVMEQPNMTWRYRTPERNPYQTEWDDLIGAIRKDTAFNEVERGTEASLITAMGRMAAHTGRVITREDILDCEHEFAPHVDRMRKDSVPPLPVDADGRVPVPQPGITTEREY